MINNDLEYFKKALATGLLKDPFLEVCSAKRQNAHIPNLCDVAKGSGFRTVVGVDLMPGEGVDVTADFSVAPQDFSAFWQHGRFNTVAVFNVLEHTCDPWTLLRNALSCLNHGGALVVLAPSVWSIHEHPLDCVRLLPDWFEEFEKRNGIKIVRELFCYVSLFGITPVDPHARRRGCGSSPPSP